MWFGYQVSKCIPRDLNMWSLQNLPKNLNQSSTPTVNFQGQTPRCSFQGVGKTLASRITQSAPRMVEPVVII